MKTSYNKLFVTLFFFLATCSFFLSSCNDEDPQKEDVPELITKVVLTFDPVGGNTPVVVSATDPDGDGVRGIEVDGAINLVSGQTYVLTIQLFNTLADVGTPAYDVSEEVAEEAGEHMFFFQWTSGIFSDPTGNGNIDNRADPVNYEDVDANGLPLGLMTRWTANTGSGTFRIVLKHQPDLKTASSNVDMGETDLDLTFDIAVN